MHGLTILKNGRRLFFVHVLALSVRIKYFIFHYFLFGHNSSKNRLNVLNFVHIIGMNKVHTVSTVFKLNIEL